ncbi:hypothetical protein DH2020_000073 [Rehmannia glutinosa]|uniref:Uncharacterized protein n=1 Tax=Rehmannia glutinosa TaxID=99300 RepID=A0ABR0XVR7_REHGL
MPPASTARGPAYLNALAALASASQRRNLLQELFADVALEVDDRAKDIIFGEEGAISAPDDGYGGPICFYDVLADHFVSMPQNGKSILDLIVQLWSQSFASNIFSLLFHKWLFEVQLDDPEVLLRYSLRSYSVTLLHLSKVLQKSSGLFDKAVVVYCNPTSPPKAQVYLLEEVALYSERLRKIPLQAQRDLFLLLSRFILFYNSGLVNLQFPDFPNSFLTGGASDIFVMELADQVEPVLVHYLSQIKVLRGLELRMTTSTRLKTSLYSFTSPGGPMYPTRAVRHAAWDALDFLFPVGQYPRHLISLFFRLLYPWLDALS